MSSLRFLGPVAGVVVALASTGGCRSKEQALGGGAQARDDDRGVAAPQPPESPSDRLGREVRVKLVGDPLLLGSGSIAVLVDGRRVILQGWVSSVNERTLAEADAATVAGVTTVDNRLVVRSGGVGSGR